MWESGGWNVSSPRQTACPIFIHNCRGCHLFSLLLRILKRLKVKDPREIELEQLEQGFSIYLNGANAEARRKQPKTSNQKSVTSSPAWRPARTAGMQLLDRNKPADTPTYIRSNHFFKWQSHLYCARGNIQSFLHWNWRRQLIFYSCCSCHSLNHMEHQLIATTPQLVVCMAWSHAQSQWINDSDSCSWQPVFPSSSIRWTICISDCAFRLLQGSSLLQAAHVPVCALTHLQMSVEAPTS